jgi:hypothetical protein
MALAGPWAADEYIQLHYDVGPRIKPPPEAHEWDKTIRDFAACGKSASQAAAALGLTKNQVIGRAWRRGIHFGASR